MTLAPSEQSIAPVATPAPGVVRIIINRIMIPVLPVLIPARGGVPAMVFLGISIVMGEALVPEIGVWGVITVVPAAVVAVFVAVRVAGRRTPRGYVYGCRPVNNHRMGRAVPPREALPVHLVLQKRMRAVVVQHYFRGCVQVVGAVHRR